MAIKSYLRVLPSIICFSTFLLLSSSFYGQPGNVLSHQKISALDGGFTGSLSNGDLFGQGITKIGDLDGDGVTDIAVGAQFDGDGGSRRGAVYILFMNDNGTVKSHQKISDTAGNFNGVLDNDDFFGTSLAGIGDLNGDNVPDIVVGASNDDDGGLNRGAVWVLFLNGDGTVKDHQKISSTQGGFTGILDNTDLFGISVGPLGDLNLDGIPDIVVGAFRDDDGGADRGAVWLLFLDTNGTVKSHQKISSTAGGFTGILDNVDRFGSRATIACPGDLDGDGIADLAVGAPLDDDGGTGRGAVWILFLNTNGTVKSHQKISSTEGNFTGQLDDNDRFAFPDAVGDLDGDGIPDLAVGAFADDDGGTNRGAVWILFLDTNGTVKSHQKISSLDGNFSGIIGNGDLFGLPVKSLGDLDGDGITDIAVGARQSDDGGTDKGSAWILFLDGIPLFSVDDITLGDAGSFALLAGGNIGTDSPILAAGNVGAISSISDSVVSTDSVFLPSDPEVQQALGDLNTAINILTHIPDTNITGNLDGLSLGPGVYKINGNADLAGSLTLNGNDSSVYVFNIDDTLNVDSGAVLDLGSVLPSNVYWTTLNSHVTVGKNTNFSGTVITNGNIISKGTNTGSLALLSTSGNITLLNNKVTDPVYLHSNDIMLRIAVFGSDTIITTVVDLEVCRDTLTNTIVIKIDSVRPQDNITIDISLPPGIQYVLNSGSGGPYTFIDNTISPSSPAFFVKGRIRNIPGVPSPAFSTLGPDTTITITYDVFAECGTSANDSVIVSTIVEFTFSGDSVNLLDTFSVKTPFISIPQTNGIVPELLEGNVGDTLCRDIVVKNDGNASLTTGLTIIETFGPSIEIISVTIGSTSLPLNIVGNQLTIVIPDSLLVGSVLLPDSIITITECVKIIACTSDTVSLGASDFVYFWECNNVACQGDSVTAFVKVPAINMVDFTNITPSIINPDFCYGPDNSSRTQLIIPNDGLAPALNVILELEPGSNSAITNLDITFIDTDSVVDTSFTPVNFTYLDTSIIPFCTDSAIDFAVFDLGDIGPLEKVILQWNTITCCPEDTVCGVGTGRFFEYTLKYQDQCEPDSDTVVIADQNVFNQSSGSDILYQAGPNQLLNFPPNVDTGDYAFINTSNLFIWAGDSSQTIQVVFTLGPGLCYDSIGGNSVEFVSGTTFWLPDSIVADIDTGICGGTVTAWFSFSTRPFNFDWLNAEFHIRLFGTCPAPGSSNLGIEVLHLPTRDPSCVSQCALSLSCANLDISIQCPGCVRHGTENKSYSVQRLNYGEPDNNDDGVADLSGTLDFNNIAANAAMVGDTLLVTATAFVQQLNFPTIPTFSDTLFKFGYYRHQISNSTCRGALTPLGATVRIYDADTTDTGCTNCSSTNTFPIPATDIIPDGPGLIYDFSFHRMPGYGFTPKSDHFSFGIGGTLQDSIIVMPTFKVTQNIGASQLICPTGPNRIYLGIDTLPQCEAPSSGSCEPDPGIPGIVDCFGDTFPECDSTIRYACTFRNGIFKLVGYQFIREILPINFASATDNCARPIIVRNRIKIGPNPLLNLFPFEYRNWGITDTVSVTIPSGFVWDSVRISENRLKGSDTVIIQTIIPVFPDDSTIDNSGNTVLLFNTVTYYNRTRTIIRSTRKIYG